MSTVATQIFSNCTVPAKAGTTVTIKVDQSVTDNGQSRLTVKTPNEVKVLIDGPRVRLNVDDVTGVYPAAGSEESADEFLPHIALTRRTLPWERFGVDNDAAKPWLALVLFRESELKAFTSKNGVNNPPKGEPEAVLVSDVLAKDSVAHPILSAKYGAAAPITVLYVRNDIWNAAKPDIADLRYLTHIRRTTIDGKHSWASTVVCNRLPDAMAGGGNPPELHMACLISLEGRTDLWNLNARPSNTNVTALVVLHSWTFRPSKGGDFEQVIRSIQLQPNGGVLRFGNIPQHAEGHAPPLSGPFDALVDDNGYLRDPLPHTQPGNLIWRGPLRPFQPPVRSDQFAVRAAPEEFDDPNDTSQDYSHATAFELGRLLALHNPGVLEDLRSITGVLEPIKQKVAINSMPPALQKPDWVQQTMNDWYEQPWALENQVSMVKNEAALLEGKIGDVGGINQLPGQWQTDPLGELESLPLPQMPPVIIVDVNTLDANVLGKIHADLEQSAHGG